MPEMLSHIHDTQIEKSALEAIDGSFNFGPLSIEYSVDLGAPSVAVKVKLAGVTIGSGVLTPANASLKIGGGVSGLKAEVVLTADFAKSEVRYEATVCAPVVGCKSKQGILVSWS